MLVENCRFENLSMLPDSPDEPVESLLRINGAVEIRDSVFIESPLGRSVPFNASETIQYLTMSGTTIDQCCPFINPPADGTLPFTDGGGNTIGLPTCDDCIDFNCDKVIDGGDLGLLLASWGCVGPDCTGDINGDGLVDGADLGLILGYWGACQ